MRKSIIKKVLRFSLAFSFLFLAVFVTELSGQKLTKIFAKELSVEEGVHIITKGPRDINFNLNGTISTRDSDEAFVMTPGRNEGIPALVIHKYQVFTTDENKVTQEIEITILPDPRAPKDAQRMMDNLKIDLEYHPNGDLIVDDNMNISGFGFLNGWLRKNVNKIILDPPNEYQIRSLEIKSKLTVPKNCNLEITSNILYAHIGDIDGKLMIKSSAGSIIGGNVGVLDASINFCKASFKNIDSAFVRCQNSTFTADKIRTLTVGIAEKLPSTESWMYQGNSGLSKYDIQQVENVIIKKSTNDHFKLGQIKALQSLSSTFSNYEIGMLEKSIDLVSRNGDIRIEMVKNDFDHINIDNQISSIWIDVNGVDNYMIKLSSGNLSEYNIPGFNSEIDGLTAFKDLWLFGDKNKAGKINLNCEGCQITILGKE